MFTESASSSTNDRALSMSDKATLISTHIELGNKLAWKLLNSWQAKLAQDEVQSLVGIALCEAANNFDGRPGVQFQTFLYYHLRGRLLREITELVKHSNVVSKVCTLDSLEADLMNDSVDSSQNFPSFESLTAEQMLIKQEERKAINLSFQTLDTLEKQIMKRHYLGGESLINLAEELGYCRCHLSRVKRRAISKLKSSLSSQLLNDDIWGERSRSNLKVNLQEQYTGGRGRRKRQSVNKIAESVRKSKKLAA